MKRSGFTLLEMMVVLTVIAVIFLLTIPSISNVMSAVNNQSCENQVKIVDTAILEYQLKYDSLPSSIQQLIDDGLLTQRQVACRNGQSIIISDGKAVFE